MLYKNFVSVTYSKGEFYSKTGYKRGYSKRESDVIVFAKLLRAVLKEIRIRTIGAYY